MTKEEWKEVEKALESLFKRVRLNVDGYELSIGLVRWGIYKNVLEIYVNGKMKGCWVTEDCEERRRFFRKKEKSTFSQKQKKEMSKGLKRISKEFQDLFERKSVSYEPWWTSFRLLKSHLIKNNDSIELISID